MKLYYKDNGIHTASSNKREEKNMNLCITCQKNNSTEKFSSTDNGRTKLLIASKIVKEGLFEKFIDINILSVKYPCSCYKTYKARINIYGCMTGRECLLRGQHLIQWAGVERVDVL